MLLYLGQTVSIKEDSSPAIYTGTYVYNKDSYKFFIQLLEDGSLDEYTYENDDVEYIKDSPKAHDDLKDLPLDFCIYKGKFCTDRMSGRLPEDFQSSNQKELIKYLEEMKEKKCFILF